MPSIELMLALCADVLQAKELKKLQTPLFEELELPAPYWSAAVGARRSDSQRQLCYPPPRPWPARPWAASMGAPPGTSTALP